jgi:hypothetical protein
VIEADLPAHREAELTASGAFVISCGISKYSVQSNRARRPGFHSARSEAAEREEGPRLQRRKRDDRADRDAESPLMISVPATGTRGGHDAEEIADQGEEPATLIWPRT